LFYNPEVLQDNSIDIHAIEMHTYTLDRPRSLRTMNLDTPMEQHVISQQWAMVNKSKTKGCGWNNLKIIVMRCFPPAIVMTRLTYLANVKQAITD
jgi:hypothetical protein